MKIIGDGHRTFIEKREASSERGIVVLGVAVWDIIANKESLLEVGLTV